MKNAECLYHPTRSYNPRPPRINSGFLTFIMLLFLREYIGIFKDRNNFYTHILFTSEGVFNPINIPEQIK
jgi:hypothetical protein